MKTKIIIFAVVAVFAVGTAHGQANLNEVLKKIEAHYAVNPPRKDAIEIKSETEKDKDGNIVQSRKLFVIRDWPVLVNELEKAFVADKAQADFVKESSNSRRHTDVSYKGFKRIEKEVIIRNVTRSYFFRIGEKGGIFYQMFGTDGRMTFTYAYATDARFIMRNIGLSYVSDKETQPQFSGSVRLISGDALKNELSDEQVKLFFNGVSALNFIKGKPDKSESAKVMMNGETVTVVRDK